MSGHCSSRTLFKDIVPLGSVDTRKAIDLHLFKDQIISGLKIPLNSVSLRKLRDSGAHNIGIWQLSAGSVSFCLKLVPFVEEEFSDLVQTLERNPDLMSDSRISLPTKCFSLLDKEMGSILLIQVSDWIENSTPLSDIFSDLYTHSQVESSRENAIGSLRRVACSFGRFLASFHRSYNGKIVHNDMTPSNVVVDDQSGEFRFIDCDGISDDGFGSDRDSFLAYIDFARIIFGDDFCDVITEQFNSGFESI
jgi:hypothetical protein